MWKYGLRTRVRLSQYYHAVRDPDLDVVLMNTWYTSILYIYTYGLGAGLLCEVFASSSPWVAFSLHSVKTSQNTLKWPKNHDFLICASNSSSVGLEPEPKNISHTCEPYACMGKCSPAPQGSVGWTSCWLKCRPGGGGALLY